jgi:hypothetical protein
MFLKDLGSNNNVFQEYGWKNTGTLFKAHLLSYAIEYTKEELDQELKTRWYSCKNNLWYRTYT